MCASAALTCVQTGGPAAATSGPQRRYLVGREGGIVRDDRQPLLQRLCDQHAVERVAMVPRETLDAECMGDRHREFLESRCTGGRGDGVEVCAELAERRLDRDFPRAGRAHVDGVARVAHAGRRAGREAGGGSERPKESVRVEEEPQVSPSKAASTSSGSGASKSLATRSLPRRIPSFRAPRTVPSGTSFATGRRLRVITISSPFAARSSNRERWVLAA